MSTALVLVHVDSLGSLAWQRGEREADALQDHMLHAIAAWRGPVVVIEQGWGEALAEPILLATQAHADGAIMVFDEEQGPIRFTWPRATTTPRTPRGRWDRAIDVLAKHLRRAGADRVVIGGLWTSSDMQSGCAVAVLLGLRALGFAAAVNPDLAACE